MSDVVDHNLVTKRNTFYGARDGEREREYLERFDRYWN